MSSILTNVGAMVALQSLKTINKDLAGIQNQISTGKEVSSSKDNAAVWAISKVMESDVAGFKAISSSLSLGESTVSVGRQAAETVTDLLTKMKDKIVAAQEDNVDRETIQKDIAALRDQIGSVVGAAQFNGLNLLSNTSNEVGSGTVNVLSSLDRSGAGVAASDITVKKQDLGINAGSFGEGNVVAGELMTATNSGTAAPSGTSEISFTADGAVAGSSYRVAIAGANTNEFGAGGAFEYIARDGDTELDVSREIMSQIEEYVVANEITDVTFTRDAATGAITMTNNDTTAGNAVTATLTEKSEGTAAGGLAALADMSVSTADDAESALEEIEGLIQTSIDAAASFGSDQGRIETQIDFVSGLTDALKAGIGTLVDADMEEASARLQALQVQQQLGVQSLSIANQAPQSLLSLFR